MDKYKNHEADKCLPDPAFNGGALMDINVYCLHFVTGTLWKAGIRVHILRTRGFNGIDTSGVILILRYPGFSSLRAVGAKDSSSAPNDVFIQGDQGTR